MSVDLEVCGRDRPFPAQTLDGGLGVSGADDPGWLDGWRDADRSVSRQLDRLLAGEPELTAYEAVGAVARALPPGGLLVVGASSPIRDLDLMAPAYPVGERRKVIANRGLSGIDGTVSTAIGAALARPGDARNLALMGDVTFLHDSNGLVLGPDEPRPDLTIVVVNDNGGSIFCDARAGRARARRSLRAALRHAARRRPGRAVRRDANPHWRVDSLPELEQALAARTAASRSSRSSYAVTTGATSTPGSARWPSKA